MPAAPSSASSPKDGGTYDAIVIGSGLGGLAYASLAAQLFGKRVVVLERHFKLGGYTHTFKRPGGFKWDVGLHYVGEVAKGDRFERLFSLVTGDAVRWTKMPDPFERFVYPDFELGLRSGEANFRADLVALFPDEARAIDQYLRDLRLAVRWLEVHATRGIVPEPLHLLARFARRKSHALARTSTADYLDAHFESPKLKALLASQWGDYGLPPSRSSFLIHAIVVRHYMDGGYYPEGTSEAIPQGAVRVLEKHGGRALVNHEVERVLLRGGRAVGVVATHGRGGKAERVAFRAPVVVSNAGARLTYTKLLPASGVEVPFRRALERVEPGFQSVTLYLGLSESPAKLGVAGENFWLFGSTDHEALFRGRNELAKGNCQFAYLSFPSLKDPKAEAHTAEVVAELDASVFAPWKDTPWRKRGEDYEALKTRITEALLDRVERRVPGLRALVAFAELSTPLSTEHFTNHPAGEIYGLPATPERLGFDWLSTKTPVKGLYLTGADAAAHGIGGALMSGVLTIGATEGVLALKKVLDAAAALPARAD